MQIYMWTGYNKKTYIINIKKEKSEENSKINEISKKNNFANVSYLKIIIMQYYNVIKILTLKIKLY